MIPGAPRSAVVSVVASQDIPKLLDDVVQATHLAASFGDDDQVHRPVEKLAVQPKSLADQPLHPVADRRVADLLADGDAEPGMREVAALQKEDEVGRKTPRSVLEDPQKLTPATQPNAARKAEPLLPGCHRCQPAQPSSDHLLGVWADRILRPRLLRRAINLRPARVRIRERNPWVLLRLRLLG